MSPKRQVNTSKKNDIHLLTELLDLILGRTPKKLFPYERATELADKITREVLNRQWREVIEYGEELAQILRDADDGAFSSGFRHDFKKILYMFKKICYMYLGEAYRASAKLDEAVEFHTNCLETAKTNGDVDTIALGYVGLGRDYCSLGDFSTAIQFHEKSLETVKKRGDETIITANYQGLGNAYFYLGDLGKAIDFYEKSSHVEGDRLDKILALRNGNFGLAYLCKRDYREAAEYHKKCLQLAEEVGDMMWKASCYHGLAAAYAYLKKYKKASKLFGKSLRILKGLDEKARESECYLSLGVTYQFLRDRKRAVKCYEKSLEIAKRIPDLNLERRARLVLGRLHRELGELGHAYSYCKHSIELSEKISGRLVEEEHRIPFLGQISDAYQLIVPLCIQLKKDDEAFEYVEKSKSRAFLDLLAATEIRPSIEPIRELRSLLDHEESCLARLRKIQTRYLRQTKVPVEPGEVERLREKLDEIYVEMEEYDSEYVFIRSGKPLSLTSVRDMLSSRGKSVVLIEYFITKDETFIFIVSSKDKELHIESVPMSEEKLSRYVQVFEKEMVDYHGAIGDTWLSLSSYLIEPISEYLAEGDLVYFVPYGPLHYLPMHVLELNGEPLIRNHPVAYSPSASLLKFCQSKGSGKLERCVSFGVVFEKEAKGVAKVFNTKAYKGGPVTKDKVRENCTDKDIIHFSCHGYFDDTEPLSSGVKLDDGVLTAREIFDVRLNTELVTLSACQTGLNERRPGDELIGLTRAFLYAGAPSVVVSLWSVDAGSTQELMLDFYRFLKNGLDKATALQEAQKKIMEQDKYSHPYYWAPFVLVGNWK